MTDEELQFVKANHDETINSYKKLLADERAEVERLKQQLAAVKWRPIEEAPKDGTWIIFRGRNSVRQTMIPVVIAYRPVGIIGDCWRDSLTGADTDAFVAGGGDFIPLSALGEPET
jgi:hypothetical protein